MGGYLEMALNVRRGEFTPASLLFLYLFLIFACYAMGRVVGSAMFLSVYLTYLPHAIVATAAVVGVFSSIYIRLLHCVQLETLVVASLLFFASSFALFWWASRFDGRTVNPLVCIWVYMAGAMGPTMGWTLANYLFTTREARRLFGFIGAGEVLGAPCAGVATRLLGSDPRFQALLHRMNFAS